MCSGFFQDVLLESGVSGNSRLPYKFVGISHEFIRLISLVGLLGLMGLMSLIGWLGQDGPSGTCEFFGSG